MSEEVLLGRFGEGDTIVAQLDDDNHVHFARGGEETREPVAVAVAAGANVAVIDTPAEPEPTPEPPEKPTAL